MGLFEGQRVRDVPASEFREWSKGHALAVRIELHLRRGEHRAEQRMPKPSIYSARSPSWWLGLRRVHEMFNAVTEYSRWWIAPWRSK